MTPFFGIFLILIFSLLSAIHIYWAFGGRWGHEAVLPTKEGHKLLNPSRLMTLMVAALLLLAGFIIFGTLFYSHRSFFWLFLWGSRGISCLFFIRAVGDFKMVGFFKKVRNTKFAYWDTRFFSPLCLIISIFTLWIIIETA